MDSDPPPPANAAGCELQSSASAEPFYGAFLILSAFASLFRSVSQAPALPNEFLGKLSQNVPCVFPSPRNYRNRCVRVGCYLSVELGSAYCCPQHEDSAAGAALLTSAFHHVGAFPKPEDRDAFASCLFNRSIGYQIGIPTLGNPTVIFNTPPWLQPEVFSTDVGPCSYFFFVDKVPIFKPMAQTRQRWHANPGKILRIEGFEQTVYYTTISLQSGGVAEFEDQRRGWSLSLYQIGALSLFCLTHVDQSGNGLVMRKERSNKRTPQPGSGSGSTTPTQKQKMKGPSSTLPQGPRFIDFFAKEASNTRRSFKSLISESSLHVLVSEMLQHSSREMILSEVEIFRDGVNKTELGILLNSLMEGLSIYVSDVCDSNNASVLEDRNADFA